LGEASDRSADDPSDILPSPMDVPVQYFQSVIAIELSVREARTCSVSCGQGRSGRSGWSFDSPC